MARGWCNKSFRGLLLTYGGRHCKMHKLQPDKAPEMHGEFSQQMLRKLLLTWENQSAKRAVSPPFLILRTQVFTDLPDNIITIEWDHPNLLPRILFGLSSLSKGEQPWWNSLSLYTTAGSGATEKAETAQGPFHHFTVSLCTKLIVQVV